MPGIFEPQFISHFTHSRASTEDLVFGYFYNFVQDLMRGGLTGFHFDQVTQIIGGKIKLGCKMGYGRQTDIGWLFGCEK